MRMRFAHGAGLLLVSTLLVGLAATPAQAATGCEAPDTRWVAQATPNFTSSSWDDPENWSNGVPTAESVVCIPSTTRAPEILEGARASADVIDAAGAAVTLTGTLTVGSSFDVAELVADEGSLVGGTTSVTDSLAGSGLTLTDRGALDQWGTAVFGEWDAQGSRITVHGDADLTPSGTVDTLDGLFTIAETGSLTMDAEGSSAAVIGGFANHGAVTVTAGSVFMMGAGGSGSGHPDEFSDGTFIAAPDAELDVAYTELRSGARLDHLTWVDHITVPAGETATAADSTIYLGPLRARAQPGRRGGSSW